MTKKNYVLIFAIIFFFSGIAGAQNSKKINWDKLSFLLGKWVVDNGGDPVKGEGEFSFKDDLNENIFLRINFVNYPANKDIPAIYHKDYMIIYPDSLGNPTKAIYFDNEGHIINYDIKYPILQGAIFESEYNENGPAFCLTYTTPEKDRLNIKFEISPTGKPEDFFIYLKGSAKRKE